MKKYVQEDFLHKALLFMKWTTLILAFITTTAFSVLAEPATGQDLLLKKVTIQIKALPLPKALEKISVAAGVKFTYSGTVANSKLTVNTNARDLPLKTVLDNLFKNYPFSYEVFNDEVIIQYDAVKEKSEVKAHATKQSAAVDVKGRVTDENGQALVGVTISIKGTQVVFASDANGSFVVQTPKDNITLVFSYVGYKTREVPVSGHNELIIKMEQDLGKLDQVQVIGYGTSSRRLNTGSVTKVSAAEIGQQPLDNPLQALEGRVPGMFIQSNGGMAGSNYTIQVRGINSIAAGNNPLYIVDGVPYGSGFQDVMSGALNTGMIGGLNPLNSLSPSDIESIEILKDADATAIYGSRGANGVILITTKKGKAGKTSFSANVIQGFEEMPRFIPMLNTSDYLQLRKMAFANDGLTPDAASAPDLTSWSQTQNTDFQKKLLGNKAALTDIQSSLSGGNEQTRFLFSGTYRREGSVIPGNINDTKGSGRLNIDHNSTNHKLYFNASVAFSSDKNQFVSDPTPYAGLPPNDPVYDSSGKIIWRPDAYVEPYALLLSPFNNQTYNLISNVLVQYNVDDHLRLKVSGGYTKTDLNQLNENPLDSQNPNGAISSYSYFGENHSSTWNLEPQLLYNRSFSFGNFDALLGTTFQQSESTAQLINAGNYTSDAMLGNVAAAGTHNYVYNNDVLYRYNSVFARLSYNYDNKYLLNGTFRRDGSSRFGADRQFGNFGALGAAWIFSEESFIKNKLTFLSFGKLRASYGVTGNDQITDYQYLSSYIPTTYTYQVPGLRASRIANPDYSWETNKKLEFALDLGFLNDCILFSAAYFRNQSGNQLVNYPLAGQTGFASYQANLPALIQNTGLELTLNTTNIKSKSFTWSSSFNITIPRNKLLSFPNLAATSYGTADLVVGKSLNLLWGYHFLGIDPKTGQAIAQDLNNDGFVSIPADEIPFASSLPNFYGGFSNSIRIKSFQLDFLIQFAKKIAPSLRAFGYGISGTMNNQYADVLNQIWKAPGDIARLPLATTSTAQNNYLASDAGAYEDASYAKLKSVNLSYAFPEFISKKLGMQKLKLFVQGQNLFTITGYKGYDPEAAFPVGLPNLRVFSAGLHADF